MLECQPWIVGALVVQSWVPCDMPLSSCNCRACGGGGTGEKGVRRQKRVQRRRQRQSTRRTHKSSKISNHADCQCRVSTESPSQTAAGPPAAAGVARTSTRVSRARVATGNTHRRSGRPAGRKITLTHGVTAQDNLHDLLFWRIRACPWRRRRPPASPGVVCGKESADRNGIPAGRNGHAFLPSGMAFPVDAHSCRQECHSCRSCRQDV